MAMTAAAIAAPIRSARPSRQISSLDHAVRPYRLNWARKDIPAASDRLDDRGLARIGLDLSPEPADLHVDAAVKRRARPPLREIEQLVPRQHALGPRDEGHEQVELAAGDVDDRAAGARNTRPAGSKRHPLNS